MLNENVQLAGTVMRSETVQIDFFRNYYFLENQEMKLKISI